MCTTAADPEIPRGGADNRKGGGTYGPQEKINYIEKNSKMFLERGGGGVMGLPGSANALFISYYNYSVI
jgi:hypothetical protein